MVLITKSNRTTMATIFNGILEQVPINHFEPYFTGIDHYCACWNSSKFIVDGYVIFFYFVRKLIKNRVNHFLPKINLLLLYLHKGIDRMRLAKAVISDAQ